jgi:hypothetical protein
MLLRPAADDPFPSQRQDDYQPPAILEEGSENYHVERITGERMVRRGRTNRKQYRVKWTDVELLEDVAALDPATDTNRLLRRRVAAADEVEPVGICYGY